MMMIEHWQTYRADLTLIVITTLAGCLFWKTGRSEPVHFRGQRETGNTDSADTSGTDLYTLCL